VQREPGGLRSLVALAVPFQKPGQGIGDVETPPPLEDPAGSWGAASGASGSGAAGSGAAVAASPGVGAPGAAASPHTRAQRVAS
jgi:hypothetical protein